MNLRKKVWEEESLLEIEKASIEQLIDNSFAKLEQKSFCVDCIGRTGLIQECDSSWSQIHRKAVFLIHIDKEMKK